MVRRLSALLLALIILTGSGLADLAWKEDTPAQQILKTYIEHVNTFLAEMGEPQVNSIFELYDDHAEMGITAEENAEIPEDVTVTVYLYYDSLNNLLLRASDMTRFPRIAAAFIRALHPTSMTQEEALETPRERAQKAMTNPTDSFEDPVEEEKLNGTTPRIFYAYYPNQYHDEVNWLQLLIIFPFAEYWDEETGITVGDDTPDTPDHDPDEQEGYEGYNPDDDYDHLEIFTTATPEPDSAAGEYDSWN